MKTVLTGLKDALLLPYSLEAASGEKKDFKHTKTQGQEAALKLFCYCCSYAQSSGLIQMCFFIIQYIARSFNEWDLQTAETDKGNVLLYCMLVIEPLRMC